MREMKHEYNFEVIESVCRVDRLVELLKNNFSTIPVVNMSGRLIGMVPRNFCIVLLENHAWYEHGDTFAGRDITEVFDTALVRK